MTGTNGNGRFARNVFQEMTERHARWIANLLSGTSPQSPPNNSASCSKRTCRTRHDLLTAEPMAEGATRMNRKLVVMYPVGHLP
jgi:hypothetical protein